MASASHADRAEGHAPGGESFTVADLVSRLGKALEGENLPSPDKASVQVLSAADEGLVRQLTQYLATRAKNAATSTKDAPPPPAEHSGAALPDEELFVPVGRNAMASQEAESSMETKPTKQAAPSEPAPLYPRLELREFPPEQPASPPKAQPISQPRPAPKPIPRAQLKPATVGVNYSAQLSLAELSGAEHFEADGLDERLGLRIDAGTGVVSGVPAAAGEYAFTISGRVQNPSGGARRVGVQCHLFVNPDPRSLWKTLEPPADSPFPKPHEASFRLDRGDYLMVGASKRGRSHAHEAKFREDAIGARFLPHGRWHLAVVCDGAGSASLSRLGSEIAVACSLDTLSAALAGVDERRFLALASRLAADKRDPNVNSEMGAFLYRTLVAAGHEAAKALERKAAALGVPVRDLSTTLILTMTRKVREGVFMASFSIGDGGAALLRQKEDYLKTMTVPDSGEYAGQTRFLALSEFNEKITERLRADVQPNFSAIMLMSDGITDPRLPTEAAFADFARWSALWSELKEKIDFSRSNPHVEKEMLAWLDFWSQGNHDDRSIAVLVPGRSA